MKLEKEKLIEKINSLEIEDDIKIPLLEDVTDSIEVETEEKGKIEELQTKYDELKEKYKERFMKGTEEKEEKEDTEELKEKEIIDIREI